MLVIVAGRALSKKISNDYEQSEYRLAMIVLE
jgi:hypothetical protein